MIKAEQYGDNHIDWYAEWQALNALVDAFADEMKRKLMQKFASGYKGWDDPQKKWLLRENLKENVRREAGQYVDIANLAAMLWNMEQDEIK